MSRTLPAGLATALAANEVAAVFLVEVQWPDGTIYMWNGYYTMNWNGHPWLGLGHLGSIAEIKESADTAANGVQLVLSGIPSALITEALRNDTQGRRSRIYFGVISPGGFVIDPYLVFDGLIDYPSLTDEGETSTLTVFLEKEFIDNRSAARRLTHQDQQIDYPGDLGFEYVAGLANKSLTWGKATVYPAATGGGAGEGDGEFTN